jgi:hypothetical protein
LVVGGWNLWSAVWRGWADACKLIQLKEVDTLLGNESLVPFPIRKTACALPWP